ncbi:hypothetical protein BJ138DRAFT_208021 [Hygrophoropsis aurantiaca]|uniref:Uncharacterized protein n=1 Tax=Hygrophoropsis aurantiaca TaxID=72124 RepID=A0ACB8A8V4_9AGAM|nr:hypothetical protein BJ138DRAFT_208021 [Hygrophoropsis aurantiaca]
MHRVLAISDIVDEIFSHFSELNLGRCSSAFCPHDMKTSRTLAALAATCRTFRDPALAVRWRRLCGVRPLIQLFNSATWSYDAENNADTPVEICQTTVRVD